MSTPTTVVKAAESKWDFALSNIFDISSVGVAAGTILPVSGVRVMRARR